MQPTLNSGELDHSFEVHLGKVAANITIDLELNPVAIIVLTKVLDEPLVASQRCEDVMLDARCPGPSLS